MGQEARTLHSAADEHVRVAKQLVDCDIHNYLPSPEALNQYLPERWRSHYQLFGIRSPNYAAFFPTRPRAMAARSDAWPPHGPPGSDLDFLREQHLDAWGITAAVLNPIEQIFMGSEFEPYAGALTSAVNQHTLEKWLDKEPRLYGSICVPYEDPDKSVAEIRRLGNDPRFLQVLVTLRTRELLGNRRYWPIYEAAVEHDLPVAVHVGGISGNAITGAGFPSYYFEDHGGYPQACQAQVISLVCGGVFEAFPALRWVLQECGFAWVPSLCWRLDRAWKLLRDEIPELQRPPSEYVREHFWYTTQPIEEPERPGQFSQLLEQLDAMGIADRLLFSSDYPHWDFDAPNRALPREMSRELRDAVLSAHAMALYGLGEDRTGRT